MKKITYNLVLNRHVKPNNLEQLGYFLAGLIDADGHIAVTGQSITINTHSRDLCVAYYIKTVVGGSIYKYKKVNACRYTCTKKHGLTNLSKLILNKLRLSQKVNQFNSRLSPGLNLKVCIPSVTDIQRNHWFAGFVQGDGSFQIKIRKPRKPGWSNQIEIVLQIELKHKDLLKQIQANFGGSVGYRKTRDTYYYSSVNLQNAIKLVKYFDQYQVMGPSYRLYLCWKRALDIVLAKQHLTSTGFEEIKCLKTYMAHLREVI
uniref:Homing endonuclease LAGLIDADG domain-containing protein n=1 Tax=Ulva intestinalis TaxID=3116 RepID=A0A8K1HTZ0_ULVIN|nr:hypothetical protein LK039_mgp35 [Ulva intestinalis]UBR43426.1 hypothetical protein [Ulva intestinalis]